MSCDVLGMTCMVVAHLPCQTSRVYEAMPGPRAECLEPQAEDNRGGGDGVAS